MSALAFFTVLSCFNTQVLTNSSPQYSDNHQQIL